jgi:hypothetical protein
MDDEEIMATKPWKERIDTLNGLSDAREVAEFLKEQGIKGYPGRARMCPISNWVRGGLPEGLNVSSSKGGIEIWRERQPGDDPDGALPTIWSHKYKYEIVPVDVPVQEFIVRFDDDEYPELYMENYSRD